MLEKTLESPLDSKEIKLVNPKGNQPWIFIGGTDTEDPTNTLAIWWEELTHWERPWSWERLKARREGGDRGWDGWMAAWLDGFSGHEFEQTLGNSEGQGSLACFSPWGHKESDMTEWLNWTEWKKRVQGCKLLKESQYLNHGLSEGHGNPLQYSCLENPRDGGAWWAAVYGVARSWTRLKRLSSSIADSSRIAWW